MKIKPIKTLNSDEQRKALLHPIRSQILTMLARSPMTVTQVAKEFDVHPANLTHHFRKLEKNELIKIHEKRDIGRVIEKYYISTAEKFEIRQETSNANSKVINFLKNDLEMNERKFKNDESEKLIGLIKKANISIDIFDEFTFKLEKLIKEFEAKDGTGENSYALNMSLYPHKIDYGPLQTIKITKGKKR